jgi:hypothetical protein
MVSMVGHGMAMLAGHFVEVAMTEDDWRRHHARFDQLEVLFSNDPERLAMIERDRAQIDAAYQEQQAQAELEARGEARWQRALLQAPEPAPAPQQAPERARRDNTAVSTEWVKDQIAAREAEIYKGVGGAIIQIAKEREAEWQAKLDVLRKELQQLRAEMRVAGPDLTVALNRMAALLERLEKIGPIDLSQWAEVHRPH